MNNARRRVGRPRCEASHQAILDAAVELLERDSLRAVTIEAIAAKAEVSKQTIYKWWPTKSALAMEAYADAFGLRTPAPDTGNLESDVRLYGRAVIQTLNHPSVARVLCGLLAEAQFDDSVHRDFMERFIERRRAHWRLIFERAIARKEIASGLDVEAHLDFLFAPIWLRLLFRRGKMDQAFADSTSDQLIQLLKLRPNVTSSIRRIK